MDKYQTYLNELEGDFRKQIRENPSTLSISDRTKNMLAKIEQIIQRKCSKEVARVKDLCSFETNNGQIDIKYKPGREKEAEEALKQLDNCQGNIPSFYMGLESLADVSIKVINNQLDICVKDCLNLDTETSSKSCMKGCFDHTYRYTFNIFQKMTISQIDNIENEINKI
jgi:hypothetical protein